MFLGIDNQEKRMLGSLLAKFHLPVLTFPPLKVKKWLNDFLQLWSQQELWIPTASQDGSNFLESHSYLAIGFTFYCLLLNWRIIAAILKHLGIIFMISNSSVILLLKILQLIKVVHQSYFVLSFNYIWLPLKIKYKHLCLYLLQSHSSYFLRSKQKEMSFG